ncbi:MAG: ABC transporter permease [Elusimicrobia bacterium]|nr:ABC transporter permease [Elusimicrobiota bacterium]
MALEAIRGMSMENVILPMMMLWRREMVRFYRDKGRVFGALVPPLIFWFLIGSGLGESFHLPGAPAGVNYLQYFFSGTVILVLLFTAIFSTISVIEDRREGFLQSVLVAPVARWVVVKGKLLGSTTLAFLQGALFLVLAPAVGLNFDFSVILAILPILAVLAFGLSALGFCLAWALDSTQGFHSVMNVFLIPLWLLSGALFPASGAHPWVRWVMSLNPLSYGLAALQGSLLGLDTGPGGPSYALCFSVVFGFAILSFLAAVYTARERRR